MASEREDKIRIVVYEATLTYNKPLIRRAVLSFWRRSVGVGFVVAILFETGALAVLLAAGDRSWWVGMLGAVLVAGVALAGAVYAIHYANAIRKFEEMGPPLASFRAEKSTFTLASEIGTATFRWAAVKKLPD